MTIPTKMPFNGMGSIQRRGRAWWMVYIDEHNVRVQENSGTEDQRAALRLLAKRALKTLAARRAAIQRIANGKEEETNTTSGSPTARAAGDDEAKRKREPRGFGGSRGVCLRGAQARTGKAKA